MVSDAALNSCRLSNRSNPPAALMARLSTAPRLAADWVKGRTERDRNGDAERATTASNFVDARPASSECPQQRELDRGSSGAQKQTAQRQKGHRSATKSEVNKTCTFEIRC